MNDLPKNWIVINLSEVLDHLQYGYTAKACEGTIPFFLRITDITENGIDWSKVPGCEISEKDLQKYRLREGDIVFARTGSIEKAWLVANLPKATVFASYLIRGHPLHETIGYWLSYFIKSQNYLKQIGAAGVGIGRQNVNAKKLGQVSCPLPPLAEQRRIVAKVEAMQSRSRKAREALEAIPSLLEKLRQSILAAAFRGDLTAGWRSHNPDTEPASKLLERIRKERRKRWEEDELEKMKAKGQTPKDDRWKDKYKESEPIDTADLPELPEGWCWTNVEELGEINEQPVLTGPFGTNLGKEDFTSHGVPVLTIGCLTEDGITLDKAAYISKSKAEELDRYKLRIGDLLFSRMASVGRAGIIDTKLEGCIFNYHIMRLRFCQDIVVPKLFVYYAQGSPVVCDYVKDTNHGATRDGINTSQLLEMPFALPPLSEQKELLKRLTAQLSKLTEFRAIINAELMHFKQLDQSILAKAFRGELVPQYPNDEPASALLERIKAEF